MSLGTEIGKLFGGTGSEGAPADEAASLREVWASLASLLRSYVGAAGLHGAGTPATVTLAGDRILLKREAAGGGAIRMTLDREQGRWSLDDALGPFDGGSFLLDAHSRITWEAHRAPLELDAAAELITELFFDAERESDPETATEAAGESGGE